MVDKFAGAVLLTATGLVFPLKEEEKHFVFLSTMFCLKSYNLLTGLRANRLHEDSARLALKALCYADEDAVVLKRP